MRKVLNKLSDDMNSKNINRNKLVKKLGIDPATLSRFLKGKHQLLFNKCGEMLKEVYPYEINARREFCRKYSKVLKRPANKKVAMYYLLSHGELDILSELIIKEKNTKNCEWAIVCELLYLRYSGKLSGDKLLDKFDEATSEFTNKTLEMEALCGIVMLHVKYDQENYKEMNKLSDELIEKVKGIEDKYLRDFLEFKIQEVIVYGLLTCAEIDKMRKYCYKILNDINSEKFFPVFRVTAYGVLGQSYIFTDFKKALFYLEEAIKLIDKGPGLQLTARKNLFLNTIDFLKIYWKVDLNSINPIVKSEEAFLEIQKGNNERALEILMEILKEKGYLDAYETFYLALAKGNDKKILSDALYLFEQSQNIFYSFLPKKYLGIMSHKCYNLVG
ncbi:AimR family lysis-lysogeny pheromone receptor [Bacillus thuringiensis]|uniref:AimR family lysis-lysogeny pheromone receptor n=1 Tax=Bacillus thuringiensis TaxID=1428 RepID=UPI002DBECC76|nr:AimR family lysis-lysogeny pheromone receptor [Bacillus thuringiensis]MEC3159345.1 AimR family lysis-lysogeny pheromone receptor [Bacillus thuringiensis]